MSTVEVAFGERSYPVVIGPALLDDPGRWQDLLGDRQALVVTNDVVGPLYLERVLTALPGENPNSLVLPDGEASKNQRSWARVLDELVSIEAGRDACVIALGGGVIGTTIPTHDHFELVGRFGCSEPHFQRSTHPVAITIGVLSCCPCRLRGSGILGHGRTDRQRHHENGGSSHQRPAGHPCLPFVSRPC